MKQEISIKQLVHKNENKYFLLVAAISLLIYAVLVFSIIGIFYLIAIFGISLLLHALAIGYIRVNAVKLSGKQFPEVYSKTEELCKAMGISNVPDIYVMEADRIVNAFATRFFRRNMIVVFSEIFELIEQNADDELSFVIAHELAHIKRNHISKTMFILPAMWIPFIGEMYLRACEYTCDRYAAYYIGNTEAAKNSLTILAIGKNLYKHVDKNEYIEQIITERGFFVWLSEKLSTHPPLPKRIHSISLFFGESEKLASSKMKWVWMPAFIVALGLVGVGISYGVKEITPKIKTLGSLLSLAIEAGGEDEPDPPIIEAVIDGDLENVQSLIDEGEDLQTVDYLGFTPLHKALHNEDNEMVQLLLDAGADPNFSDDYGESPLMTAAGSGNHDLIKLILEAGGDPNYQEEEEGMTPLIYAVQSEDAESVKLLLKNIDDPNVTNVEDMTALDYAMELENKEIINILKKASK